MLLVEKVEDINKWLSRDFGLFDGISPTWRVVFAGDQVEKRIMTHTDEGFELLYPEVREVRKYQHIKKDRYVLERLVPVEGETDIVAKLSYEPAWTFEDRHGDYLPPLYIACKMIIEGIYNAENAVDSFRKYTDPDASPEAQKQKVLDMEKKLFGDETKVSDALGLGMAVTDFNPKVNFSDDNKSENAGESK